MVVMIARPSRAKDRSVRMSDIAVVESRPDVGSSRMITEGLISSSWPTETRLRSPPDTPRRVGPPTSVFLHFSKPRAEMTPFTRSFFSYLCSR